MFGISVKYEMLGHYWPMCLMAICSFQYCYMWNCSVYADTIESYVDPVPAFP